MATSRALGRALEYLESPRNLVGCAAGAGGLGLYFAGLVGSWWPAVVAGLYGAGALLVPGRGQPSGPSGELAELVARVAAIGLPASVGADRLLAELGAADPALVERIVGWELPVALDGYVRARCWAVLAPGGVDPVAALEAEVERLSALL